MFANLRREAPAMTIIFLRVLDWTADVSLQMSSDPKYGLWANALMEDKRTKLYIAGEPSPLASDVKVCVIVAPEYVPGSSYPFLGERPPGLMDKEPRLLGTVIYLPDDLLSCVLYLGHKVYDELWQLHRSGAGLPSKLMLTVEGLAFGRLDDEVIWDRKKFPELAIVGISLKFMRDFGTSNRESGSSSAAAEICSE
jgi:hypothetical protein